LQAGEPAADDRRLRVGFLQRVQFPLGFLQQPGLGIQQSER
jgi:hypothetical protein